MRRGFAGELSEGELPRWRHREVLANEVERSFSITDESPMNPQHFSFSGLVIAIAIVVLLNDRRPISVRRIGIALAIIFGAVGAYVGLCLAFAMFS